MLQRRPTASEVYSYEPDHPGAPHELAVELQPSADFRVRAPPQPLDHGQARAWMHPQVQLWSVERVAVHDQGQISRSRRVPSQEPIETQTFPPLPARHVSCPTLWSEPVRWSLTRVRVY